MANEKFVKALRGEAQKVPPIWFMRQAGRYHRHYQELRARHDFMTLCKDPELAAEVAMGPIQDFDFDVAILFSDLLFPLEALGMGLRYDPGPVFDRALTPADLKHLRPLAEAAARLEFQKQAVICTRERLPKEKSLIGFVGGTFTLFAYAVGGSHDGQLIATKTQLDFYERFGEVLLPLLEKNIELQLSGGAEIVMVFDTAVGELSPALFKQFVAPQLKRLVARFPGRLGYYSRGTQAAHLADAVLDDSRWAGYGIDHRWELAQCLRERRHGFIQGNFDQALLFADGAAFDRYLRDYLRPLLALSPEERARWVCGLGHGVLPKTPEDNVRRFVVRVREEFAR